MADEFNSGTSSGQQSNDAPQEINRLDIDTSQVDGDTGNNNQLPDDLTRILNDANPIDTAPQNAPPPQNNQPTGVVHMPPDGVQGETLGDKFDMDALINQTAQAVSGNSTATMLTEKSILDTTHSDAYTDAEHGATVQHAEPTVVTVPGFDIETTAMASVPLQIVAEIGNTELRIEQLMKIGRGAIIEIDKDIESELELKIGHHLIGQGHLESDGEYFQIRVVNMIADIDEHHTLFHASTE
ncbi:MAG: FliM/FliN family flagellar motor switch protein [Alphaproteobacteria bacterium]|nr:FliM/FliN family flagellar motor switch protein [Alphaproteobacteria bacterium]